VQLDLALPAKFEIGSVLDLIGAHVRLPGNEEDEEDDVIVASPFAEDRTALQQYLLDLMDHTTVVDARVIPGRINVNLAPRAVLLGVPGMEGTLVERIVATRRRATASDDPRRRHAAWLLTEGLVDLAQMKALLPYLTAGGDVFRAQVIGYLDEGGAASRVELVVDATSRPPRRVYWKDLRLFGHGYPTESLGAPPPGLRPAG
jgi:hypothetical protein